MAIANALQLEAARRRASPLLFNWDGHAKFEAGLPISSCLIAFLKADTLRYAVTLTFDPLILNVCCISGVTWSNAVPNMSEIEQSAAELSTI